MSPAQPGAVDSPTQEVGGRQDRRSDILRAAYRVMARDGVHRAPLARVAEEAGVSKGLLLYHFHTKDALVLSALEWALEGTASRIRRAIEEVPEPGRILAVMIEAIWVGPEQNRDFFRFYLDGVEHQARAPGFDGFGATAKAIINGLYCQVIEAASPSDDLGRTDVDAIATTMRATIEGFFLQWLQSEAWAATHGAFREQCRIAVEALLSGWPAAISCR